MTLSIGKLLFLAGIILMPVVCAALPPIPEGPAVPTIGPGERTYYVDNESGRDVANDGSAGHPWRTVKYAVRQLRAGDALIVRGTRTAYKMDWASVVHSGTAKHWITIEGENGPNGQRTVFEGRLSLGAPGGVSVSYLYLKHLLFRGGGASGINLFIYEGSNHLVLEDLEINCERARDNERGIWTGNHAREIWFKDVSVHHCGYQRMAPAAPPPVWWKPPTDCGGICVKGDNIADVVFMNVETSHNVGDGMGGGSKKAYGTAYFKHCISSDNTGDGFDIGGLLVVITDSISRNNGGDQGAGFKFWSKQSWLVNSVAYRNHAEGVSVKPTHDGEDDAYILNSTLALNSVGRYGGQVGTTPRLPRNGTLFFHIHNNIFYALNTSAIVLDNVETQAIADESHNYYFSVHDASRYAHWSYKDAVQLRGDNMRVVRGYSFPDMNAGGRWARETGHGAGDIGQVASAGRMDPGFVNLGAGDLHLTKGSLAIGAGVDLGNGSASAEAPAGSGTEADMGAYPFSPAGAGSGVKQLQ